MRFCDTCQTFYNVCVLFEDTEQEVAAVEDLAFWRNIALVFLIVQFFALVVVAVALSYLLVRVTANLHTYAQKGANKAQEVSRMVAEKSDLYAEKARSPIVRGNATGAGITVGLRSLFAKPAQSGTIPPEQAQTGNTSGRES